MSKKLLVMIAVIMAIICVLSFTACKQEEEPQDVKFTVTFDLNYEGAPEPFLVTVNENAVVPTQTAPVRNGYNFGGWYVDKTCTTEFTFDAVGSTAVIVKDITLYAKWTAKEIIDSTPILSTIVAFYNGENVFVGEDLDVADIVVTATYTDTSKKAVTNFTISGFDSETAGVKTITVTYTENGATRTATVDVTVVEKVVLASINAVYGGGDIIVGKTLNVADIVVIATYSDETKKAITDFSISGFDSETAGAKTVTVSYTEGEITKTADVIITVKECEHTGGKATCKTLAVCTECGESYGELDLDNHEGTAEWTITETTHARSYTCCSLVVVEEGSHEGGTATCKTLAECTVCETAYGELNADNHEGTAEWTITETTHAQSYTCCSLVVVAEGNHEGGTATCITKAECTVCEESYGELNLDNHVGTAEWTITETTHAQSYICCDAVVVAEENHEYDNACDADCNECGYVREVGDHAYDNACDTNCNHCGEVREVGDHVYDNACDTTCNECGDVREVEGHVYDNACDTDCNECGDVREVGDHVYSSDCDTTCNECGDVREAGDHTYDGACDTECNECGNIREAGEHTYDDVCDASCNVCGTDREAPHSYASDCDEVCDLCGATRETEADHIYEDGTCKDCGAVEPAPVVTGIQASLIEDDTVYFVDTEVNDTVDCVIAICFTIEEVYNNGNHVEIAEEAYDDVVITLKSGDEAVAGPCVYTLSYNGFTCDVEVTLVRKLLSIAVTPEIIEDVKYNTDLELTVTATYAGAESSEVVDYEIVNYDKTYTEDAQLVTIKYTENNITATADIYVQVVVSNNGVIAEYLGDPLAHNASIEDIDVESTILAVYTLDNGDEGKVIDSAEVSIVAVNASTVGNNGSITIQVGEFTYEITGITVVRVFDSYEVSYVGGIVETNTDVDLANVKVVANYSDESTEDVEEGITLGEYDNTTTGIKEIEVLVNGEKVGTIEVEYVAYNTIYYNNVGGWDKVYAHSWGVTETPIAPKAGDYVVTGSFNGWTVDGSVVLYNYSTENGGQYYFEGLKLTANTEFKICKVTSSNGTLSLSGWYNNITGDTTLYTKSDNIKVKSTGIYNIYFKPNQSNSIWMAKGSVEHVPNVKIDTVFDGTTWPGVQMTAVEGQDGWYAIKVDARANRILFNNGLSGTSEKKTADLVIDASKPYYNNGVWESHIHTYSADCDTTCNYEGCTVTRTTSESHVYPSDCTATTCTVCNEVTKVAGTHTGGEATCIAKAECTVCGLSYGEFNVDNHEGTAEWTYTETTHTKIYSCCDKVVVEEENHEYDNACDVDCNVCGATRTPADHTDFSYNVNAEDITKHDKVCGICNVVVETVVHVYVDGECVCGKEEPETITTVGIQATLKNDRVYFVDTKDNDTVDAISASDLVISEVLSDASTVLIPQSAYENVTITILSGDEDVAGVCTYVVGYNDFTYNVKVTLVRKLKAVSDDNVFEYGGNVAYGSTTINIYKVLVTYYGVEGQFDVTDQVVVGDFNPTYVMGEQLVDVTYTENGITAPWQISIMVIDNKGLTVTQKENVDALVLNHEQTSVEVSEILAIYDVKFVYDSGKEEVVTTDITVTVSAVECGNNGSITITVDGQSVTIEGLTVVRVLEEIIVEYTGNVEIDLNKEINTDDITVTAIYSNDDEEAITDYELSEYDYTTVGTKTISVLVDGDKVGEFTVKYVSYTTYYFNNVGGWEEVYAHSWGVESVAPKAGDYVIAGVNGWAASDGVVMNYDAKKNEYSFIGLYMPAGTAFKICQVTSTAGSLGLTGYYNTLKDGVTVKNTYDADGNIKVTNAGIYDFYFDVNSKQLWLASGTTKNEANVKTVFDGTTWPGTAMTAVEGQDGWYSVKIDNQANRIIFNNNDGVQTETLALDATKPYYNNGVWEDHIHIYSAVCDDTCNYEGCEVTRTAEAHKYDNACDASCNNEGCEYTRVVGDHVYDNESDVDCNECGAVREIEACVHEYDNDCDAECNLCGEERTIEHDYTKLQTSETEHWYVCSVCDVEKPESRAEHTGGKATCIAKAVCTICGESYGDFADHVYDNACDTTCNVEGCGNTRDIEHNIEYVSYEDGTHGVICAICTEIITESEACSYTHEYAPENDTIHYASCICGDFIAEEHVDEDANNVCDKCEQELEVVCEHTDVTYDCNDNGTHNVVCSDCGDIIQENVTCAYTHEYAPENETIHYASCICGDLKEEEHVYDNACDADCNACGTTRTPADHVYDNACDVNCNACGEERTIEHDYTKLQTSETEHWYVCSVCDVEKPESRANHSGGTATCIAKAECTVCETAYGELNANNHEGTAEWTYTDDTHTKVYTCCDAVVVEEEAHEYVDGTCECGKEEPEEPVVPSTTTVTADYIGSTTTNMVADSNNAATIGLDANIFNVLSEKTSSGTHVGLNKNGNIRIYANNTCTLTISVEEGYTIVSIKVTYASTSDASGVLVVTNGTNTITAVENTYTINGNTVVLSNSGTKQVHLDSIEIVYSTGGGEEVCTHEYDSCEDTECNLCGETREALEHAYDNDCDAECNNCGDERTPADHVYDNACDADCNECGATRTPADHNYEDGACTECGKEEPTEPEDPEDPVVPSTPQDFELSFADKANRTSFSTTQQVWAQNGVTVTNDKASSTNPVADYANPVRLYASSTLTVEYASMTKIVFNCSESKYVTPLVNSITSGGTATSDGNAVTVVLDSTVDSFTLTLGAQVRINSIVVTALVGGGEVVECEHTGGTATCTSKAVCDLCGEEYGEVNAEAHNWNAGEITTPATCSATGTKTYTCTHNAEHTKTEDVAINEEAHTQEAIWAKDADSHRQYYPCCEADIVEDTAHTWENGVCSVEGCGYTCEHTGGEATCIAKAVCIVCETAYGDFADHTYDANVWESDDNQHWHVCTVDGCDVTDTKAVHVYVDGECTACGKAEPEVHEHEYNNDCDTTCNTCGETREVGAHVYTNACDADCNVCGEERTPADHVYDDTCDTTCNVCAAVRTITHTYDNDCDAICNVCEAEREVGDHVYDNACDTTCNECSAVRTITHTYDNACDAECNVCEAERTPADHVYDDTCDTTCNVCGAVRTITHTYDNACDAKCNVCEAERTPADHVYDDTCDTTCNVCGAVRTITHTYDNACDAECNVCGEERTPADHVYDNDCDANCNVCNAGREVGAHVYDNACDADCNECGATRTPADHVYDNACDAKCNVCEAEREVADHVYEDCDDITCNVCNATREPVEHNYVEGICDVCGKEEPETITTVGIQASLIDDVYFVDTEKDDTVDAVIALCFDIEEVLSDETTVDLAENEYDNVVITIKSGDESVAGTCVYTLSYKGFTCDVEVTLVRKLDPTLVEFAVEGLDPELEYAEVKYSKGLEFTASAMFYGEEDVVDITDDVVVEYEYADNYFEDMQVVTLSYTENGITAEYQFMVLIINNLRTIYFKTENNSWTKVNAYLWVSDDSESELNSTWPGVAMTDSNSDGWYELVIDVEIDRVIFNNGTKQTTDLVIDASKPYYIFDATYVVGAWGADTTVTTPTTRTIYYYNLHAWTKVYAYSFVGETYSVAWPGKVMTAVGDGWYSAEIKKTETTVIFNNNGTAQTANLTMDYTKPYFIAGVWQSNNEIPTTVTITLNRNGIGWSDSNATVTLYTMKDAKFHKMTYKSATGIYSIEISLADLSGGIIFTRHSSSTPTWDNKWNQTGDVNVISTRNYTLTDWNSL